MSDLGTRSRMPQGWGGRRLVLAALLLLAACDGGGDPGGPASRAGIDQDINAARGSSAVIGSPISPSFSDSRFSDRQLYGGR